MVRRLLLLAGIFCLLLGVSVPVMAAPQVITATGSYVMGENDSPKIAKEAARQDALRSATEQAGVYVESYSKTKNMELTDDEVKMVSGAILKVTDEKATPELVGDVWKYTVTLTATVDTDNIDLQSMMQNRNEMEKLQQERDELKKQNQELLEKYKQASGSEKRQLGSQLENQYTLSQTFDQTASYIQQGDERQAISTISKVIDNNRVKESPRAYAYYLRGVAYYKLSSETMALDDFNSAQNTPHDNSTYPIWRLHYYRGLIYYDQQHYQDSYDELKLAWDASDKTDDDIWNALERSEEKLDELNGTSTKKKNNGTNWGAVAAGAAVIGAIIAIHNHNKHKKEDKAARQAPPPPPRHAGHFAGGWAW